MDRATVGRILTSLRGETRREVVAAAVGISVSSLTMYEMGLRTPRDPVKIALAAYYGKSVHSIFFPNEDHSE